MEQEEDQAIRGQSSLSHAAHRFDSIAKPFAICALTFASVVLTAIKARTERKNDPPGKAAYLFLDFIAGARGATRIVLSGMLADAMDEALMLTRSLDHELADTSLLHSQLERFMKNTQTLFVSEKCVESGFTKHMLEAVKKQWIWVDGAQARSIGLHGGIPGHAMAENLKEMAAWTALAAKVIATEFPSFDLMLSFRCFALSGMDGDAPRRHLCMERAEQHSQDLERLCKAMQVESGLCRQEFALLVGVAEGQKSSHRCSNLEAWQRAVAVTARSRARYTIDALVLEAFACWVCSTSGVEQNFAVRDWLSPKRRSTCEQTEVDELQIRVADDVSDENELFQQASAIWARLYGKPRSTGFLDLP